MAEYVTIELSNEIISRARELVVRHSTYRLRTLDALRVQTTLATTITFLSADNRLLHAAQAEDFPVDNPNDHP